MVDLSIFISFFGWCSIINIGVLFFSFIFITVFRELTIDIHSKLTGVDRSDLPRLYFQYIGLYKIATLAFNIVPYFALQLIAM